MKTMSAREAVNVFGLAIGTRAKAVLVDKHGRAVVEPVAELLGIVSVALSFSQPARAETSAHLSRPVWGCVDPNEVTPINDNANPARSDPQWVAQTAAVGQCIMLGSAAEWDTLSEDYNGLTYVRHSGGIGPNRSFWVPTSALVIDAKQSTPAPTVKPTIAAARPSPQAAPSLTPVFPSPSRVAAAPEPAPAPSMAPSSSPQQSGGISGVWAILGVLFMLGFFGRSRRRKTSAQRKPKARTAPPVVAGMVTPSRSTRQQATATAPDKKLAVRAAAIDFRIHPASLSDSRSSEVPDSIRPLTASPALRVRVLPTVSKHANTTNASPKSLSTWHPPGTSVSIADTTIADGMVYVGKASGSYKHYEECFIDPELPLGVAAAAEPLGY